MTTTTETRFGSILGAEIWTLLAHEYLHPTQAQQAQGASNARELADHIAGQVLGPLPELGGELAYKGAQWRPVEDSEPYASLKEMVLFDRYVRRHEGAALLVSDLYHSHPVFTREDNLRFRVWHDTGHIEHGLGFDVDGELRLFSVQARALIDGSPAVPDGVIDALFSESVYQLAACVHLGGFPDVQHVVSPGPIGRQVLALLLALPEVETAR